MGVIPGTSIASDADEIQSRVQKVGKLNISGATAEPAAPAEATVTETAPTEAADTASTEAASTETAADTTSTETASTETAADTTSTSQAVDSAALYQASCFACHGTGAAGSPVLGDKEAWAPRIAQSEATLLEHAINGFNAMPPRGASMLKDDELKAVVAYMVENSQ
ncbi:MAG: cytochrome c5 family protein [Proteobacteria bacterium]|nr:cytochrome c5 family protein [Pseudomonadota bacterium]